MGILKPDKNNFNLHSHESVDSKFSKWMNFSKEYGLTFKMRFPVSFPDKDIDYYLKMLKGDIEEQQKLRPVLKSIPQRSIAILIKSKSIGKGEQVYSEELLSKFIFALTKVAIKPKTVVLMNEAVLLSTDGSTVLDSLRMLEKQGVQICISNNCAEFYKCSESTKIGNLLDLYEIGDSLLNATKVITL